MRQFEAENADLVEAIISPVLTKSRWIYSCECVQAATAFSFLGCPLPRSIRVAYLKHLLLQDNCKKVICWSHAGKTTFHKYGGIKDENLLEKVTVVYPAIRTVPDRLIRFRDGQDVTILFSGFFFRKGGVNVVDAFLRARKKYPSIQLRLCCDERIDFDTPNSKLRAEYLGKVKHNDGIIFGRVRRDELVHDVLPGADIYLLPTYAEAFGFAILEAMAFGVPVVSTNHFAIPEMVEDNINGFLIDTSRFNCERMFKGYVVNQIPPEFREHVTECLYRRLCQLIESAELRRKLGMAGVNIARTKFSFEERNRRMLEIYRDALR